MTVQDRPASVVSASQAAPTPFLSVRNLVKYFDVSGGTVARLLAGKRLLKAVDDISFEVPANQTLAIVGESGSGKSTTARLIARLIPATRGQVLLNGKDILQVKSSEMRTIRKQIQIVFQDPFSSLNPRMRIEEILGRPLSIHFGLHGRARRERVAVLLEQVGLAPMYMDRFPHEFSGGQRQRIAIARALAPEPTLLLADEPVSALDVSVQAQVIELLQQMRERHNLTMLFITHDLNVAEYIADIVAVMYGGKIMEMGPVDQIFRDPQHPYTRSLLEARPKFGERVAPRTLSGEPATPINPPPGCRFAHRCPIKIDACTQGDIPFAFKAPDHPVACIRA